METDLEAIAGLVVHDEQRCNDSRVAYECLLCRYRWTDGPAGELSKGDRTKIASGSFADDGSVPGPTPATVIGRQNVRDARARAVKDIRHALKVLESVETALQKALERSDPAHTGEEVKSHTNARLGDATLDELRAAKRRRELRGEGWGSG